MLKWYPARSPWQELMISICLPGNIFLDSLLMIKPAPKKTNQEFHLKVAHLETPGEANSDEAYFEAIFANNYEKLLVSATQYVNDVERAKDIVQDLFINFWLKRHDIKGKADIAAYLSISLRNKCFDYLKMQASHKRIERSLSYQLPPDTLAENVSQMEAELTAAETLLYFKNAIDQLSDKHRHILELFYYEGMSIKQIAEQLCINQDALVSQKARIIAKLRRVMNT